MSQEIAERPLFLEIPDCNEIHLLNILQIDLNSNTALSWPNASHMQVGSCSYVNVVLCLALHSLVFSTAL